MEKLELRHIAPYHEHKVKLTDKHRNIYNISYLSTKNIAFIDVKGYGEVQKLSWPNASGKIKPILRNLSDLTKEIEHNGERFVPLEKLRTERWGESLVWMGESPILESYNTFDGLIIETDDYSIDIEIDEVCFIKNRLHEWHFDTEGLIEKGLAIDYNKVI